VASLARVLAHQAGLATAGAGADAGLGTDGGDGDNADNADGDDDGDGDDDDDDDDGGGDKDEDEDEDEDESQNDDDDDDGEGKTAAAKDKEALLAEAFLADHPKAAAKMWGNAKPAAAAAPAAHGKKTTRRRTTRVTTTRVTRRHKASTGKHTMTSSQQRSFDAALKRAAAEHENASKVHLREMEKFGQMMTSMGAMTSPLMAMGDNTQFNSVLDKFGEQQVPGNPNSKKGPSESEVSDLGQQAGQRALMGMIPMMMKKDNDDPSPLLMAISGF
jgi:hypothetical protein